MMSRTPLHSSMEQIPSPVASPAVYDGLSAPKLLASLYQQHQAAGFLHPALSQHLHGLHPYNDPFRPRSGSLLSLGSNGSSHRFERSPSRESTSSHESLTRVSPFGYPPESPSPSPPNESSKLFGLLKGTISSPYQNIYNKQSIGRASEAQLRRPSFSVEMTIARKQQFGYGIDDATGMKKPLPPTFNPTPDMVRTHRSFTFSESPMKRSLQDGPMDLSCKSKRSRIDSIPATARRFPPPSETVTRSSLEAQSERLKSVGERERAPSTERPPPPLLEPISPPSRAPSMESVASNGDDSSILRSILLNTASSPLNDSCYPSRPASAKSDSNTGVSCASPGAFSEPASPNNILSRLMAGSPCNVESNQRVGIAKKTLFPVRARVTYWLAKTVQFAKSLPEFCALSEQGRLLLVTQTWAKMLVLFMAENNFEFAVSPVLAEPTSGNETTDTGNRDIPTMKGVDSIQGFIKKCHSLSLDATEYGLFKAAVLFQPATSGLKDKVSVEAASTKSREALQKYVSKTRPEEKLRYSNILLRLHALSAINSKMIENLFCKHITSSVTINDYLNDLLFEQVPKPESAKSEKETAEKK